MPYKMSDLVILYN